MALFNLLNSVQVGTSTIYAGTTIDSVADATLLAGIQAGGGSLVTTGNAVVAAAAVIAVNARHGGASAERVDAIMIAAMASAGTQGAQGAAGAQGSQGAQGAQAP